MRAVRTRGGRTRAALLELCDTHVRIPMLGLKHSLNVASAGAIVMYELLRKYRLLSQAQVLQTTIRSG